MSWLAIIYEEMGNTAKAQKFIDRMLHTATGKGIPELYFSNSKKHNANNPLGWAESLFIVALHDMNEKCVFENKR